MNNCLVVMGDALGAIRNDQSFGKSVADACSMFKMDKKYAQINSKNYHNAACVIESHRSDCYRSVWIGCNGGFAFDILVSGDWVTGFSGRDKRKRDVELVRRLAADLGYRLVKTDLGKRLDIANFKINAKELCDV
jgi:hypothetical protein